MKNGHYETAEKLHIKIFDITRSHTTTSELPNFGELNKKLGKIHMALKKFHEAEYCFEIALKYCVGEIEKMILIDLLK